MNKRYRYDDSMDRVRILAHVESRILNSIRQYTLLTPSLHVCVTCRLNEEKFLRGVLGNDMFGLGIDMYLILTDLCINPKHLVAAIQRYKAECNDSCIYFGLILKWIERKLEDKNADVSLSGLLTF